MTNLLESYDEILEIRRRQLRTGRDHLAGLLAERFSEWKVPQRVPGGLTFWINLGAPVSSQLTLAARNEGSGSSAGPLVVVPSSGRRRTLRRGQCLKLRLIKRVIARLSASTARMMTASSPDWAQANDPFRSWRKPHQETVMMRN